jgi:hypothetical protein
VAVFGSIRLLVLPVEIQLLLLQIQLSRVLPVGGAELVGESFGLEDVTWVEGQVLDRLLAVVLEERAARGCVLLSVFLADAEVRLVRVALGRDVVSYQVIDLRVFVVGGRRRPG